MTRLLGSLSQIGQSVLRSLIVLIVRPNYLVVSVRSTQETPSNRCSLHMLVLLQAEETVWTINNLSFGSFFNFIWFSLVPARYTKQQQQLVGQGRGLGWCQRAGSSLPSEVYLCSSLQDFLTKTVVLGCLAKDAVASRQILLESAVLARFYRIQRLSTVLGDLGGNAGTRTQTNLLALFLTNVKVLTVIKD